MALLKNIMKLFTGKQSKKSPHSNLTKLSGKSMWQGYVLYEINDIAYYTSSITRKLLISKGFTNTIHAYIEKHVLLGTEISELADAVKKGKGFEEECEELADIAIRASNFLCCDEVWQMYNDSFKPDKIANSEDIVQVVIKMHWTDTEVDMKYAVLSAMMSVVETIRERAEIYANIHNRNEQSFSNLISSVYELIAFCSLYSEMFLSSNLQSYINDKMRYNFERPYKYNTFEEVTN